MSIIQRLADNQNYQFWLFQAIFWVFWASIYLIFQFEFWVILADSLCALILTTGLRFIYQLVWEKNLAIRIVVIMIGSALTGLAWNVFKRYLELTYIAEGREALMTEIGAWAYYTSQFFGLSFYIILAWSGLYVGLTLYNLLQEERTNTLNANAMAHEAQLRMLRYQLNPHFLFNTLNDISTLILDADKRTANDMVSKLSNFLRYSLDKDPLKKVDLNHEIATLELYLDIEKVRFEERLRVSFNINEDAGDALIPSMLLQPLVENSIKYAIADSEHGGEITITAQKLIDQVVINVTDDGPGIEMQDGVLPEFRGVGIRNIRDRLKTLYGSDHSCRINPASPHGLNVEIRIPYEIDEHA